MKKVVKFGGSSLASAEQFKKVGNIIRAEESRRYVVPSAPGKRFSADTKVTDMLYGCYAAAENGEDFTEKLAAIKDRYQEIIDGLGLKFSLDEDFEVIRKNFSEKAGSNYAASRGEFLNGKIMAAYLGFEFIDAACAICQAALPAATRSTRPFPGRRSCSARRTASSGRTAFRLERRITSASRRSAAFIDSPSLQRCPPLRDSAPETAE